MSFNGSGTFSINTAGQPVVTATTISSTAFNALTADLGTGLSTAICKDGQTTCTARIPFAAGINSSLATDASSTATGSIITAGGIGCAKAIYGGTTMNIAGAVTFQSTLAVTTSVAVGATPATTGAFRLANAAGIVARNQTDSADIELIRLATNNAIKISNGGNDVQFGVSLVGLGGGSPPTLGTIGGSGPATAGQNSWMRWIDSAGNAMWVPVWK